MILSIFQPTVFPRLYLLNRIAASDKVVILDSVQYTSDKDMGCQAVVYSPTDPNGGFKIPVAKPKEFELIKDKKLLPSDRFTFKFRRRVMEYYSRAPFSSFLQKFDWILSFDSIPRNFYECCEAIFGKDILEKKLVIQSQLAVDYPEILEAKGKDLVVLINRIMGANVYMSGCSFYDYMDQSDLDPIKVKFVQQDWKPLGFIDHKGNQLFNPWIFSLILQKGIDLRGIL